MCTLILIADDHEDTRIALVKLLKKAGLAAVAVASGAEALLYLKSNPARLLILDMTMPRMDGLDVLAAMRDAGGRVAGVPVICYSAVTDREMVDRAMQLGAKEYVVKGTTWGVLFDQIRKHILAEGSPSEVSKV